MSSVSTNLRDRGNQVYSLETLVKYVVPDARRIHLVLIVAAADKNLEVVHRPYDAFKSWSDLIHVRAIDHVYAISSHRIAHMAGTLFISSSAVLSETPGGTVMALDTERTHVLRCKSSQQSSFWLQYLGSSPYHPSEWRYNPHYACGLCMGETIHSYSRYGHGFTLL